MPVTVFGPLKFYCTSTDRKVNNFSHVQTLTNNKQLIKCLAQGQKEVPLVRLEPPLYMGNP